MLRLLLTIFTLIISFVGLRSYKRKRRWKKVRRSAWDKSDQKILEQFKPMKALSATEKEELTQLVKYFLKYKNIQSVDGSELSREFHIFTAAHATLMLLNLPHELVFEELTNIYITPSSYVEEDNPVHPLTGRPIYEERIGELRSRGPMLLSRESLELLFKRPVKKHNLIVHEFAHALDQMDGHFDGTPKLSSEQDYKEWGRVMGEEFIKLRQRLAKHRSSPINPYAATNEAEFFAVLSEHFFSAPHDLERHFPELFAILLDFYRLDPRRWEVD